MYKQSVDWCYFIVLTSAAMLYKVDNESPLDLLFGLLCDKKLCRSPNCMNSNIIIGEASSVAQQNPV